MPQLSATVNSTTTAISANGTSWATMQSRARQHNADNEADKKGNLVNTSWPVGGDHNDAIGAMGTVSHVTQMPAPIRVSIICVALVSPFFRCSLYADCIERIDDARPINLLTSKSAKPFAAKLTQATKKSQIRGMANATSL